MIRLCDVGISVGETLVVSAENRPLVAIATGTMTTVSETTVSIIVDRSDETFHQISLFFCVLNATEIKIIMIPRQMK